MPSTHRALAAALALFNLLTISTYCQNRDSSGDHLVLESRTLLPRSEASEVESLPYFSRERQIRRAPSGLVLTRLGGRERQKWDEMTRLARTRDKSGTALYPTLAGLIDWAEGSIHQIIIEIADRRGIQSSTAGSFNFEKFEAGGQHAVVIRLNLQSIDSAVISESIEKRAGFTPFRSLKRAEKYVEVLGHELAHAKFILSSEMRSHFVRELVEAANGLVIFHAHAGDEALKSPEIAAKLRQRDQLLKDLEANAYETEEKIWKELLGVQSLEGNLITSRTK